MSSSSSNNRKRSRWGSSNSQENSANNGAAAVSVSDQEALNALLSSAKAKEEEKSRQAARGQNDNRNNNGGPPKRSRGDDHRPRGGRRDDSNHADKPAKKNGPDYSYYGRPDAGPGTESSSRNNSQQEGDANNNDSEEPVEKEKPNFGLSGALAQEQVGDFKFREPPEARAPNTRWRLYVFKDDKALETLHISRQSAYLIGRNKELCDILVLHPSLSGQHAVLQYRALPRKEDGLLNTKPYLMDLESTNGSFINGVKLDPARYYELKKGDVLKFGASTREYVLLTETTKSIK